MGLLDNLFPTFFRNNSGLAEIIKSLFSLTKAVYGAFVNSFNLKKIFSGEMFICSDKN